LKRRCLSSREDADNDDDDKDEDSVAASPAKRVTMGNDVVETAIQLENTESMGASSSRLSSSTSSDEDEEGDSSSKDDTVVAAAAAASVLLIPKERPTTLDMVVKNVESLFRLLKK